MSTTPPPKPLPLPRAPTRPIVFILLLILLVAFSIEWYWLIPNSGAEADAACYLLTAKNIATHADPAHISPDPLVFVPEHMVEVRPGVFYPIYPIGYPALCALAYAVGGPLAPFYVNPLLLLIGLVGAFFLARLFLDDLFALAATAFLGLHPALLYYGVIAMSHAAEFTVATWCLYFVCAWYQRPRTPLLVAAAILVSVAISIRYTGALLAIPLGYVILIRLWDGTTLRRVLIQAALAAGAGLLALLPLLLYLRHAFGSPFTTGYSLSGEAAAFSLQHFLQHAPYALKALCQTPLGLSLFFPLGLGGIACLLRRQPRLGGLLALCTLPTLLLYASYYWFIADRTPWWQPVSTGSLLYIRFFLGIFPMLVIAALLLIDRFATRPDKIYPDPEAFRTAAQRTFSIRLVTAGAVVLLGIINVMLFPRWEKFLGSAGQDDAAMRLVRANIPASAVVMADGYASYSLLYQTDMVVFYPRYFAKKWVNERLALGTGTRPADFNPLRREHFASELENRSDNELFALLRQRLVRYARDGRSLWLITQGSAPPWYMPLTDVFTITPVADDPANELTLLRLTLKDAAPGQGHL